MFNEQFQAPKHQQIIKAIENLPSEALPELANFLEYLHYKNARTTSSLETKVEANSGSPFLLSIAGLGACVEDNLSERDEQILADEIDPVRGWNSKPGN